MLFQSNDPEKVILFVIHVLVVLVISSYAVNLLGFDFQSSNYAILVQPVSAQTQVETEQEQYHQENSIPHDVKGHESHQIVNFLVSEQEGKIYKGVVSFNLSKPVDIISFIDIAGNNDTSTINGTKKLWYTDTKILSPQTLLKNVTEGTTEFTGHGVLAHRAQNDTYTVNFSLSTSEAVNSNR